MNRQNFVFKKYDFKDCCISIDKNLSLILEKKDQIRCKKIKQSLIFKKLEEIKNKRFFLLINEDIIFFYEGFYGYRDKEQVFKTFVPNSEKEKTLRDWINLISKNQKTLQEEQARKANIFLTIQEIFFSLPDKNGLALPKEIKPFKELPEKPLDLKNTQPSTFLQATSLFAFLDDIEDSTFYFNKSNLTIPFTETKINLKYFLQEKKRKI